MKPHFMIIAILIILKVIGIASRANAASYLPGYTCDSSTTFQINCGESYYEINKKSSNNLVCNNQKSETNCSNHNISLGPFSAAFNKNLVINHEQYRFSMHGRERIAGRSAVKIKITPRFGDRFGYRLWLDEESSLPLQSQLFQRNRILEVFQFSSLEMGQQLDKGNLDFMEDDTFANRVVVNNKIRGKYLCVFNCVSPQ